jgi:hypothetical protein
LIIDHGIVHQSAIVLTRGLPGKSVGQRLTIRSAGVLLCTVLQDMAGEFSLAAIDWQEKELTGFYINKINGLKSSSRFGRRREKPFATAT